MIWTQYNLGLHIKKNKNKKQKKQNKTEKKGYFEIEQKIQNVLKSKTTKKIVDFNCEESASIKSFAIKKKKRKKRSIQGND